MGFLKEVNQFMIKYGEIALTKTDIFVQMVKLKIEIKKKMMEMDKIKSEAGEYVISQYEKKEPINESVIKSMADRIILSRQGLEELQVRLDSIKLQLRENGTEFKDQKQV